MKTFFTNDSFKKRYISASLVFFVFSTETAFAANADGFFTDLGATSIENQTSGLKTFTDANGNRVESFGGSLVLKRKQVDYPLWWHFQAPEIQASCSGISFKGMFGAIANLDEIQKQLEQAGSSFAWGVLVGIIYSLPGIGEIFSKLDAWAKKIQAMLADACNAGIAIGKELGEAGKSYAEDKVSSWYNDSAPSWINSVGKDHGSKDTAISGFLDCAADYMNNVGSGTDCLTIKKQIRADLGAGYFGFPSLVGGMLQNYQQQNNNFPIVVSDNKVTTFDWTNQSDLGMGITDSFYQDAALVTLIIGVTGDAAPAGKLDEVLKPSIMVVNSDTTSKQQKQASLKDITNAVSTYQDDKARCEVVGAKELTPEQVANFLYYGTSGNIKNPGDSNTSSTTTTISTELLKSLSLPKVTVYKSADSGRSTGNYVILPSKERTPISSNGQTVMSQVTDHLANWDGVNNTTKKMMDCYLNDTNCGALSKTLFDAPSARYIAKVYRNTKEPIEKKAVYEKTEFYIRNQLFNVVLEKLNLYKNNYLKAMKIATPSAGTTTDGSTDTNSSNGTEATPHMTFAGCTNDVKTHLVEIIDQFQKYSKKLGADLNGNQTESDFFFFLGVQDKKNNANALGEFKK